MNRLITERQQAFPDADRVTGMAQEAAAQARCSGVLRDGAMRTSETYREAFDLVRQDVAYELEEEARRRAIEGVTVPVGFRGKVSGDDTRSSDALRIFLLEANNPETFAGIQVEPGRNDDGFCVRCDREEMGRARPGRARLGRMSGPMPPAALRPPQPPRPSAGECGEPVGSAARAAVRGFGNVSTSGPVDPERLRRRGEGESRVRSRRFRTRRRRGSPWG